MILKESTTEIDKPEAIASDSPYRGKEIITEMGYKSSKEFKQKIKEKLIA